MTTSLFIILNMLSVATWYCASALITYVSGKQAFGIPNIM